MVHTIDLFFRDTPCGIAAYLIESNEGPILFETGPHSCFGALTQGIEELGHRLQDIKHVFLTHIHLDHAGAAWDFAQRGARIYVHPFGAPHLADPSRFLASAQRIYGDAMDELWGTIKPIEERALSVPEDGTVLRIGDMDVVCHYTPGHAKHHIAWQVGHVAFTGDVAGIKISDGPVIPPCPPPDIDLASWHHSIDKLLAVTEIDTYYLGHFGRANEVKEHMAELKQALDAYARFIKPFYVAGTDPKEIIGPFENFVARYLSENGISPSDMNAYQVANPADMSVAGLLRYWHKFGS
ncbi:MAG: MBL fold metallo-hydrolase [Saprospiraceae bacterium]|nr:MBL fold metallo-hydrolase [Saprospiraceae bacterium]